MGEEEEEEPATVLTPDVGETFGPSKDPSCPRGWPGGESKGAHFPLPLYY